ncbi:high affinity cationic amino acid transporter 1-like [Aphidius gifuensis]|uniref:high affinity cationic amino acid transporter 1-like n=1 Tax=Aphidius gifuensis TaxID=684658 RepID=UPI001CDBAD03|nr:high affinity cationic amino acid transporter 1-like [Aphidius gifuensis]
MKRKLWQSISRRRDDHTDESKNQMARVMGIFDLTALGVGATLGLGIYILAAEVAKNHAGPAVCISFLIAAIASALSGICYAEFASRVPKSGSAYIYSYVTVGEFIAFIIGWNLVFEYIIGTASVAKGLSKYIDSLSNNSIHEYQKSIVSFEFKNFAKYPDFFALLIVIILTVFLCIGVKESNYLNLIFGAINLTTIIIVIIAGAFNANIKYWQISPNKVTEINVNVGNGGFVPFEISGIISGAAQSFFGFIGFDAIASCSEESKNPKKNVPRAIIISLIIIFISYMSIAIVLTLMWPYYLQNPDSAFPHVFKQVKMPEIGIIVNIGGLVAMIPSLIGALFPASRILNAMANDGLIFKCFTSINKNTQTPIFATIISGIVTGIMTMIFDLEQLVSMASIGSLLAYSIVAMSVLFLRYQNHDNNKVVILNSNDDKNKPTTRDYLMQFFNLSKQKSPTDVTCKIASWTIFIFTIFSFIFAIMRNIIIK